MADLVLAAAGAAVGFAVGGPMGALYGAQLGFTAGSMIGASGQTIQGPKIGEVAVQNSKEGVPRPIVFGVARPIGGNIMALGKPIIVVVEEEVGGGKGDGGGTTVEREEVYRTYAIRICEGPVSGVRRVWRDNKLVYDSLAGVALEYLQQEGGVVQETYTVNVVDPAYTGPTVYEYQYDGKGPTKFYYVDQVADATGGEAGKAFEYFDSQGAYIQEQRDGDLKADPTYSGDRIFGYTAASALTQVENNNKFLETATFYLGGYDQMPDPALEAEFGVANVTAYRGTCYMVMDNEDLTPRRGSVPNYVFEVARGEGFAVTSRPYPVETIESSRLDLGIDRIFLEQFTWKYIENQEPDKVDIGLSITNIDIRDLVIEQEPVDNIDLSLDINTINLQSVVVEQEPIDNIEIGVTINSISEHDVITYEEYLDSAEIGVTISAITLETT